MLPPGLTLNSSTGVISGTVSPTAPVGNYPFTVKMCDENPEGVCCQKILSIAIEPACPTGVWTIDPGFTDQGGVFSRTTSFSNCEVHCTQTTGVNQGFIDDDHFYTVINATAIPITVQVSGTVHLDGTSPAAGVAPYAVGYFIQIQSPSGVITNITNGVVSATPAQTRVNNVVVSGTFVIPAFTTRALEVYFGSHQEDNVGAGTGGHSLIQIDLTLTKI